LTLARPTPLKAQEALLAKKRTSDNICFVEHLAGAGDAVLPSACRMHLEGIIRLDGWGVSTPAPVSRILV
jgi:hypothetical protein